MLFILPLNIQDKEEILDEHIPPPPPPGSPPIHLTQPKLKNSEKYITQRMIYFHYDENVRTISVASVFVVAFKPNSLIRFFSCL